MAKQAFYLYLLYLVLQASIMQCYELPIVVLICSYNNQEWVAKNLDSVFMQNYENYRIVYIDDCSKDATALYVQSYRDAYQVADRIHFISNPERCRKMKNIYNGIHSLCSDHEIVVQLDGDDAFIDDQLFDHLNKLYQTHDIWLTYGSDTLHYAQPTPQKIMQEGSFRKHKWIYAPTRTFYAWLFKAIKLQDFIAESVPGYQGLFFPSADDVAFMYPMLEMAASHCAFIKDTNYEVNTHNPLSNKKIEINLQDTASADVRSRAPYKRLLAPAQQKDVSKTPADICLISENVGQLANALDQLSLLQNHGKVFILALDEHEKQIELACKYPHYQLYRSQKETLSNDIEQCAHESKQPYFLLMNARIRLTEPINLGYYEQILEKTKAYAFYFGIPITKIKHTLQHLFDEVYAWKLAWDINQLSTSRVMTLLRPKDIIRGYNQDPHALGLCTALSIINHSNEDYSLQLDLKHPECKKKIKKRRLHVPGVDSRTKQKKE